MEGVQLRTKRGLKDETIRRSYSCSDIAQLLGGGSDGESGDSTSGAGESAKRKGSDAEVRARGVSTLVKLRKRQSKRKKGGGAPVISSPIHPSSVTQPPTRKLSTILPQNINFNNPFGTIGRRTKRKPREGMPVVVLEKCFGPPPSSTLSTVAEQNVCMYPNMNPFATLPRKRRGPAKDSSSGSGGGDASERNSHSANLESFFPPSSSSLSPSRSPSRSPSPSPSSSPSRATLNFGKSSSTNLTAPSYHTLLGKSMEKVC